MRIDKQVTFERGRFGACLDFFQWGSTFFVLNPPLKNAFLRYALPLRYALLAEKGCFQVFFFYLKMFFFFFASVNLKKESNLIYIIVVVKSVGCLILAEKL